MLQQLTKSKSTPYMAAVLLDSTLTKVNSHPPGEGQEAGGSEGTLLSVSSASEGYEKTCKL